MWVQEVCFDKQTLSDYVVFIDSNVCINIFIDNNILFLFQQPGLSRHIVVIQPFIPCTPVFQVKLKLEVKLGLGVMVSAGVKNTRQEGPSKCFHRRIPSWPTIWNAYTEFLCGNVLPPKQNLFKQGMLCLVRLLPISTHHPYIILLYQI